MNQLNKPMTITEWGLLLSLSVLWGASFFFASVAVLDLPPLTIVCLRVGIAAIVLHIVIRVMGQMIPGSASVWRAFFVMGLMNNVIPFSFLVWGQTHIPGGLASILNATTPMFTVLVAHAFTTDEKMTPLRIAGVLSGLFGVAIMIGADVTAALDVNVWAQLACIAAPVSYAFAAVYGRRFRELGVTPMATATGQVTASAVMLLPVVLIIDQPWLLSVPGTATIVSILGLAVLSTSLAYIIYFRILATAGSTNLALVTFLVPVSAILLGTLILSEVLESRHLTGMALITLGLAAIDGRLLKRFKPQDRP